MTKSTSTRQKRLLTADLLLVLSYFAAGSCMTVGHFVVAGGVEVEHLAIAAVLLIEVAVWAVLKDPRSGIGARRSVLLCGIIAVLFITAAYWRGGANGTYSFLSYLAAVVMVIVITRPKYVKSRTDGLVAGIGLSVFLTNCILLFFPELPIFHDKGLEVTRFGIRLTGPYDNANLFGGVQLLGLASLLYIKSIISSRVVQLLVWGGIVTCILVTIGTQSRSAVAGIVAMLFTIWAMRWRYKYKNTYKEYVSYLAFAIATLTIVVAGEWLLREGYRLLAGGENGSQVRVTQFGLKAIIEERLEIVLGALEVVVINPLGIGLGDVSAHLNRVAGIRDATHNFVLDALVRFGWFGGAFIVGSIATGLVVAGSPPGDVRPSRRRIALLAGGVAYLVHNMFHAITNWIYWWMWFAVLVGYALYEDGVDVVNEEVV